jgi:hypothetical protein
MSRFLLALAITLSPSLIIAGEHGEPPLFNGQHLYAVVSAKAGAKAGEVLWSTAQSAPMKAAFDALFFQGIVQNKDIVFQASVKNANGWGPWLDAVLEAQPNGRFWAKIDVSGKPGDLVRLRAVSQSGAKGDAEIFAVHAAENEDEPGGQGGAQETVEPRLFTDTLLTPIPMPAGPQEPEVLSRADWGAAKAKKPYEPMVPVRISVHHTEGFQAFSKDDAAQEMRSIQSFHQKGRGWIDIAYHFLIDGSGRIWQGRPLGVIGAHVKDKNDGNVGISLMGDFHAPRNNHPSKAQIDSLVALMRWLTVQYGIPVDRIKGHRDQEDTSCPGDILYAQLDSIRQRVAAAPSVALPSLPTLPTVTSLFDHAASGLRGAP